MLTLESLSVIFEYRKDYLYYHLMKSWLRKLKLMEKQLTKMIKLRNPLMKNDLRQNDKYLLLWAI